MKNAPEEFRLKKYNLLGSDSSYGNNGFFIIPHYKISDYFIMCQISDGEGWDHVSVTIQSTIRKIERCPTWEEMCFVKNLFFEKEEICIQFHPAEKDYVSFHHYCLHIWKPQGIDLPTPDPLIIGPK